MIKNISQIILVFSVSLTFSGCLSSKKELAVSPEGHTYYVSEEQCPFYEILKDNTVKCFDEKGKFLMILTPLNENQIATARHEILMKEVRANESHRRWDDRMNRIEYRMYDYDYYDYGYDY